MMALNLLMLIIAQIIMMIGAFFTLIAIYNWNYKLTLTGITLNWFGALMFAHAFRQCTGIGIFEFVKYSW